MLPVENADNYLRGMWQKNLSNKNKLKPSLGYFVRNSYDLWECSDGFSDKELILNSRIKSKFLLYVVTLIDSVEDIGIRSDFCTVDKVE